MSNATGAVKFADGTIRYFEYAGTSDVCISHLYETTEDVSENWRNHEWLNCDCGKGEPVSIYTQYGGGFYINGEACKHCNSLTTDTDFNIIERKETSDWAKDILNW